jgi:hypothetical protein
MLDIFRPWSPITRRWTKKKSMGTLTQFFVEKAVRDFNLWMEPMQDVCSRGAHKYVSEVMHVPDDADLVISEGTVSSWPCTNMSWACISP